MSEHFLHLADTQLQEAHSALLVAAKGLAAHQIIASVVAAHSEPDKLLLILNANQGDEELLAASLKARGLAPPAPINNECDAPHRMELYLRGGAMLVTSRILAVDLLCGRVPSAHVSGILVANAHRVGENSNVAFALRMFRQQNSDGFVRAISDSAAGFTHGFSKVEKVMRALTVSKLLLWPRFHVAVAGWLSRAQPEVEEISAPLSRKATELQRALLQSLDTCVAELCEANPSIDVSQLTTEKALLATFDSVVRIQLDPVWQKTSRRTRALVDDLKTLRKLLGALATYDAVSFFELLESVIDGASALPAIERPHWLLQASEAAYVLARERVYALQRSQLLLHAPRSRTPPPMPADVAAAEMVVAAAAATGAGSVLDLPSKRARIEGSAATDAPRMQLCGSVEGSSGPSAPLLSIRLVLEESPKWAAFLQLLSELESARMQADGGDRVLIVVRDDRVAATMSALVARGSRAVLEEKLVRWVARRPRSHQPQTGALRSSRQHEAILLRTAAQKVAERLGIDMAQPRAANPQMAAGGASGKGGKGERGGRRGGGGARGARDGGAGRGGARGGGARGGGASGGGARGGSGGGQLDGSGGGGDGGGVASRDGGCVCGGFVSEGGVGVIGGGGGDDATIESPAARYEELMGRPGFVLAVDGAASVGLVEELAPRWIVLYDASPAMVRAIEVEQARRPEKKLSVYLLVLSGSTEEQLYRSELQAEKEAFENLIRARGQMVLPEPGAAAAAAASAAHQLPTTLRPTAETESASTLRGGRGASTPQPAKQSVVVDLREFNSTLPNMLHLHGVDLHPLTLEVGDYVLTPEVCVERKTVPDLTASLASGRLYNQAEAMCRYYKRPMLLLEFGESRQVSLAGPGALGQDISAAALTSKLALLLIHFPRLRLLWSRRALHTIALFDALKKGLAQPEPAVAASLGVPSAHETSSQVFNMTPQDLLRQLPGVHPHNYRRLMNRVENLEELAKLSVCELGELLGAKDATLLHTFLHRTQ